MNTPIPLNVLVDARDALRAIKDLPGDAAPSCKQWVAVMSAHNRLDAALWPYLQATANVEIEQEAA